MYTARFNQLVLQHASLVAATGFVQGFIAFVSNLILCFVFECTEASYVVEVHKN